MNLPKQNFVMMERDLITLELCHSLYLTPHSVISKTLYKEGSKNAYYRLDKLVKHGYLRRYKKGELSFNLETLYEVANKARPIIQSRLNQRFKTKISRKDRRPSLYFAVHQLNLVYLFPYFSRKLDRHRFKSIQLFTEPHLRVMLPKPKKKYRFSPDALLILTKNNNEAKNEAFFFIEYEHTAHTQQWKGKIQNYELYLDSQLFNQRYNKGHFKVLTICHQPNQVKLLKRATEEVTTKKRYFFCSEEALKENSPYDAIWLTNDKTDNYRSIFKRPDQ